MSDSSINKEPKDQPEVQAPKDKGHHTESTTANNVEDSKEKPQSVNDIVNAIIEKSKKSSKTENKDKNTSKSSNSKTSTSKNKNDKKIALTQEELTNFKIIEEIENLLEPSNVLQDHNLRSRMNEDGYVHIEFLKSLPTIHTITTDTNIILNAISRSKKLKCKDNTYIKYEPSHERNVLILRDFPTNIPSEDVGKIFDHAECGAIKEIRPEVGNNWFVSFETEEECIKTVKYLQKYGAFQNKPLHVRVKSSSTTTYNPNSLLYDEAQLTTQSMSTQQSENAYYSNADQLVYDQMYSTPPLGPEYGYPPYVYYPYSPIQQSINTAAPPVMQLPPQHSSGFPQSSPATSKHHPQQHYQHPNPLYPQYQPQTSINKNIIPPSTNATQDERQFKHPISTTGTTEPKFASQTDTRTSTGIHNPILNVQESPIINAPIAHTSPKLSKTSTRPVPELPLPQPATRDIVPSTEKAANTITSGGRSPLMSSTTQPKNIVRQWTSDYPNDNFQKYSRKEFVEAFENLSKTGDLSIPNSMKGRDFRIVSEVIVEPNHIHENEESNQKQHKIRKQKSDDYLFHDDQKKDDIVDENENEHEQNKNENENENADENDYENTNENDYENENTNDIDNYNGEIRNNEILAEDLEQEQQYYQNNQEVLDFQQPYYYNGYNNSNNNIDYRRSYNRRSDQNNKNNYYQNNFNPVYRSRRNKQQQQQQQQQSSGKYQASSYYSRQNYDYNPSYYNYEQKSRQQKTQVTYRPKRQDNQAADDKNNISSNKNNNNQRQNTKLVYKPKTAHVTNTVENAAL